MKHVLIHRHPLIVRGREHDMAAQRTIADQILISLSQRLRMDVTDIKPEYSLRHDLRLDSADSIELVFALEEMFDLDVPDEDFRKWTTVSEVIGYVEARLHAA
jgi:acyl carrier protein